MASLQTPILSVGETWGIKQITFVDFDADSLVDKAFNSVTGKKRSHLINEIRI